MFLHFSERYYVVLRFVTVFSVIYGLKESNG